MAQDVTLADGDERWVVPAATVHGWLSFEMLNGLPHPTVDVKGVLATLKPFATSINRDPVSATMFVNKDGKTFGTTPSTDGRTFNASKTTTGGRQRGPRAGHRGDAPRRARPARRDDHPAGVHDRAGRGRSSKDGRDLAVDHELPAQ